MYIQPASVILTLSSMRWTWVSRESKIRSCVVLGGERFSVLLLLLLGMSQNMRCVWVILPPVIRELQCRHENCLTNRLPATLKRYKYKYKYKYKFKYKYKCKYKYKYNASLTDFQSPLKDTNISVSQTVPFSQEI